MRTLTLNDSIGTRIKENTGFWGTFYTWDISAWQETTVKKKHLQEAKQVLDFGQGGVFWFLLNFFSLPGSTDTTGTSK